MLVLYTLEAGVTNSLDDQWKFGSFHALCVFILQTYCLESIFFVYGVQYINQAPHKGCILYFRCSKRPEFLTGTSSTVLPGTRQLQEWIFNFHVEFTVNF